MLLSLTEILKMKNENIPGYMCTFCRFLVCRYQYQEHFIFFFPNEFQPSWCLIKMVKGWKCYASVSYFSTIFLPLLQNLFKKTNNKITFSRQQLQQHWLKMFMLTHKMSVLWEGKIKAKKGYCCPMGLKRFVNLAFRKKVAKMWSSDFNAPIFVFLHMITCEVWDAW